MKKLISCLSIVLIVLSVLVPFQAEANSSPIKAIDCVIAPDGNLVCIFENTSDDVVPDFEVQFLFNDAAGNIVFTESDGHDAVLPHSQVVTCRTAFIESSDFSTITVSIDPDRYTNNYINHSSDLNIKTNIGKNCVIAQIINNAGVSIEELECVVVFFNGDHIVGATEESAYDISPDSNTVLQFHDPIGGSLDYLTYDSYKLYINQAHTF